MKELLAYSDEVHQRGIKLLPTLDTSRLHEPVNPQWTDLTMVGTFQRLCNHLTSHHGQIEYLIGLIQAQNIR